MPTHYAADVLNPMLYNRLVRLYGSVRISNPGFAMQAHYGVHPLTGKTTINVDDAGETYCVNCDRCGDTRHRLRINHRFGRRDADTGQRLIWLVYCQNENCYAGYDARQDLLDRLSDIDGVLEHARIVPSTKSADTRAIRLPGPVTNLAMLPPWHPANRYLGDRFLNPEMIGKYYRVGYCDDSFYTLARKRIIIPIYQRGELKGWQARFIGDLDWHGPAAADLPPKYFTCPGTRKSQLLYNLDNARTFHTIVVMEGPTDVWSFGPMGVATLGFPMSVAQLKELANATRGQIGKPRPENAIVFLFDADVFARDKSRTAYEALRDQVESQGIFGRTPVAWVRLPDGYDPGSLDRGFLRPFVAQEASRQGIRVQWRQLQAE